MRRYDGKDRRVLSAIADYAFDSSALLGDKIGGCLKDQALGVLVLPREESAYLFSSSTRRDWDAVAMADMAAYMALLTSSRDSGLIYCVDGDKDMEGAFFCGNDDSAVAKRSGNEGRYDWAGGVIETDGNTACVKNHSGKILMKGLRCPDSLGMAVCRMFLSHVYPTQELYGLKDNDFKDAEMRSMEQQLKEARKSVCYSRWALGLALLMPVVAIFLGNLWGYSKMDTSQYDGLMQRIDSVCQKIEKQDVVPFF